MISNSSIQKAWITELKSNSTITSQTSDIRENNWKGTDFNYSNIRVKMGLLTPQVDSISCKVFHSLVSILVHSADKSSKQADDIAGIVADQYWAKGFTSEGVKFIKVSLESLAPAEVPEENENIWRSAVNFKCLIQTA